VAPTSPTTWQLIGQLSTIGLSFVFALVLGFGAGYWLDQTFGTQPWLSFIGFFCGLAAGVLNVYRVLQLSNASARSSKGPKGSNGSSGYDGSKD
jgi:F0F1-type ATP synthase assembly protein I